MKIVICYTVLATGKVRVRELMVML